MKNDKSKRDVIESKSESDSVDINACKNMGKDSKVSFEGFQVEQSFVLDSSNKTVHPFSQIENSNHNSQSTSVNRNDEAEMSKKYIMSKDFGPEHQTLDKDTFRSTREAHLLKVNPSCENFDRNMHSNANPSDAVLCLDPERRQTTYQRDSTNGDGNGAVLRPNIGDKMEVTTALDARERYFVSEKHNHQMGGDMSEYAWREMDENQEFQDISNFTDVSRSTPDSTNLLKNDRTACGLIPEGEFANNKTDQFFITTQQLVNKANGLSVSSFGSMNSDEKHVGRDSVRKSNSSESSDLRSMSENFSNSDSGKDIGVNKTNNSQQVSSGDDRKQTKDSVFDQFGSVNNHANRYTSDTQRINNAPNSVFQQYQTNNHDDANQRFNVQRINSASNSVVHQNQTNNHDNHYTSDTQNIKHTGTSTGSSEKLHKSSSLSKRSEEYIEQRAHESLRKESDIHSQRMDTGTSQKRFDTNERPHIPLNHKQAPEIDQFGYIPYGNENDQTPKNRPLREDNYYQPSEEKNKEILNGFGQQKVMENTHYVHPNDAEYTRSFYEAHPENTSTRQNDAFLMTSKMPQPSFETPMKFRQKPHFSFRPDFYNQSTNPLDDNFQKKSQGINENANIRKNFYECTDRSTTNLNLENPTKNHNRSVETKPSSLKNFGSKQMSSNKRHDFLSQAPANTNENIIDSKFDRPSGQKSRDERHDFLSQAPSNTNEMIVDNKYDRSFGTAKIDPSYQNQVRNTMKDPDYSSHAKETFDNKDKSRTTNAFHTQDTERILSRNLSQKDIHRSDQFYIPHPDGIVDRSVPLNNYSSNYPYQSQNSHNMIDGNLFSRESDPYDEQKAYEMMQKGNYRTNDQFFGHPSDKIGHKNPLDQDYLYAGGHFHNQGDFDPQNPYSRNHHPYLTTEADHMKNNTSGYYNQSNMDNAYYSQTMSSPQQRAYRAYLKELENKRKPKVRICSNCKTTSTPSWRRCGDQRQLLCNACGLYKKLHGRNRPLNKGAENRNKNKVVPKIICNKCGTSNSKQWRCNNEGFCVCDICFEQITLEYKQRTQARQDKGDGDHM